MSIVFREAMSHVARKNELSVSRRDFSTQKWTGENLQSFCEALGGWTPPPPKEIKKHPILGAISLERITGLEPATSTLARWRSTK